MLKGVDQVFDSCESYDRTISIRKTVVYQAAPWKPYKEPTITVKGQRLPVVDKIVYLGSTLSRLCTLIMKKKGKRKVQGVPQSQTTALTRPQEEVETDKSKQAQIERTYEKHQGQTTAPPSPLPSPSEATATPKGPKNTRTKWHMERHTTNRLAE